MTKTRFLALLSVLALLASLPLTVALAQGAPFLVVGEAEVDGEAAMMGTTVVAMSGEGEDAMMWEGMVVDDQGNFSILVDDGEADAMLSFSIKMGEGEEAMEYMAESTMDVMIGGSGEASDMVMLAAYSDPDNRPAPAAPTKTAEQEMEAMRGPQGRPGSTAAPGEMGPQGEPGAKGNTGARGPAGPDGAKGDTGPAGSAGSGSAGNAGAPGTAGSDGAKGDTGDAGPAGPPGSGGAAGEQGASGGGTLALVALIVAIVGIVAAGGAFIAGRNSG